VDSIIALLLASARKDDIIPAFCKVLAHLKPDARAAASDDYNSSSHSAFVDLPLL